ncbi:lanthionine synthetase LanC family protein [Kitasatospora sp. NPDC058032]|uniref:lanthionine synthetase LanC family protein n=1 Tax=Kitasatospora sp. NPDC058032 TaxID=3346307 RepID=UPI0036D96651
MNPDQALDVADRLADPAAPNLPSGTPWWRQSLAHGAPGVALLHAELAAAGLRPFDRVHAWLAAVTTGPVTTGVSTGLLYGAPAVAFALAAADTARPGTYGRPLAALEAAVASEGRRRASAALARAESGQLPELAEFDAIRGLAGIGAHLLHTDPDGDALRQVLVALVRLAKPLAGPGGRTVPGWWTPTGPAGLPDPEFPGGHGNFGMGHGLAGPIALASLAALRGVTVPGQLDAVDAWCRWLDRWRIDTLAGSAWPYMVTLAELDGPPAAVERSGATRRPSWCYGTAGTARAQQLAALATGDPDRRRLAEHALLTALTDPAQRARTVDSSLCHGHTGLARIAALAADDAEEPAAGRLRALAAELLALAPAPDPSDGPGLLEGSTGTALAALTTLSGKQPATRWDTRLLIA